MKSETCNMCEEPIPVDHDDLFIGPNYKPVCESCFDDARTDFGSRSCSCHTRPPCGVCLPGWEALDDVIPDKIKSKICSCKSDMIMGCGCQRGGS